jgi:hypothetical protein
MARPSFDGVVEAVHYAPDGQVLWVRVYERRGATFSDRVLLDRKTIIERLKSGKKYVAGQRVPYLASTFEVSSPLRLFQSNGKDILIAGDIQTYQDNLDGVPVI